MTGSDAILIVGLPRSGTTWTLRALAQNEGTKPLLEPDNEDKFPQAIHAKRGFGRYPVLEPGDQADGYRTLWDWILRGACEDRRSQLARHLLGPGAAGRIHDGRRDPVTRLAGWMARIPRPRPGGDGVDGSRIVAKSIHAQLATEWLATEFNVTVLLLLRHPANVLASWLEVKLKDARNATLETRPEIWSRYLEPWGVPLPGADPVERVSWRIGLLTAAIEDSASRHPEWHLRTHESLCFDPVSEFRKLSAELGLGWGEASEAFLAENDTPGNGYAVKRIASEQPGAWRRRLDSTQVATLRRALELFPIATWSDRDFAMSERD